MAGNPILPRNYWADGGSLMSSTMNRAKLRTTLASATSSAASMASRPLTRSFSEMISGGAISGRLPAAHGQRPAAPHAPISKPPCFS